uniref:Ig-like domain-containing protein n=1 Tax=Xenopus tropicalis TaxID=8364 RepID=A0A803KG33_XENTR
MLLAEFRDQKFIRENENYFPNRLEGSNSGTALLIRELRMEDSGIFTALFLVNGEMTDIFYNVTVWEPLPIPTPVIEKTLDGNSSDLCHLHCSVPSNSPTLSYSWTYRDTGTDRLYANGSTITVSLKDKALGAEFTCWVQNTTHRNSTSVPLYPCGEAQTEATRRGYWRLIIPMSLLCVILVGIAVYCRRRLVMQRPAAPEHQADIKDGADEQIPLQEVLSTPASMVNSTDNRLSPVNNPSSLVSQPVGPAEQEQLVVVQVNDYN